MSDTESIIEQLRDQARILCANGRGGEYLDEAADEIERLLSINTNLERQLAESQNRENETIDLRIGTERKLYIAETALSDEKSRLEDNRLENLRLLAELRETNHCLRVIADNDCENEAAARKAAGPWDRSDTYGVDPLVDIIERLRAEITRWINSKEDEI